MNALASALGCVMKTVYSPKMAPERARISRPIMNVSVHQRQPHRYTIQHERTEKACKELAQVVDARTIVDARRVQQRKVELMPCIQKVFERVAFSLRIPFQSHI